MKPRKAIAIALACSLLLGAVGCSDKPKSPLEGNGSNSEADISQADTTDAVIDIAEPDDFVLDIAEPEDLPIDISSPDDFVIEIAGPDDAPATDMSPSGTETAVFDLSNAELEPSNVDVYSGDEYYMDMTGLTPTGCDLVVGMRNTGSGLDFGFDFSIDVWMDDNWYRLPTDPMTVYWMAELLTVRPDCTETIVTSSWKNIWGALPDGKYRILKTVTDLGSGENLTLCCEFSLASSSDVDTTDVIPDTYNGFYHASYSYSKIPGEYAPGDEYLAGYFDTMKKLIFNWIDNGMYNIRVCGIDTRDQYIYICVDHKEDVEVLKEVLISMGDYDEHIAYYNDMLDICPPERNPM